MRASSLISLAIALVTSHVRGAPSTSTRKLEPMPQGEEDALKEIESFLGKKLERELTKLTYWGKRDPEPWNGPLWDTCSDSINLEWRNDVSPSAKYALAFGLNVEEFMDKVSAKFGIDSMKSQSTECTSECLNHGDVCSFRKNSHVGYCISQWSSLSQGVAQAAMLEQEPLCPVTVNNVTFHPNDIKGLISIVYAEANVPTIFGGRYFDGQKQTFDKNGRSSAPEYRDVTPSFFHIVAANLLGNMNQAFIFDWYTGESIQHQAVSGFDVYLESPMTLQDAARKFFNSTSYTYNGKATEVVHVSSSLSWSDKAVETDPNRPLTVAASSSVKLSYLLEVNKKGDAIGGEWVGESLYQHPDVIILPKSKPAADFVSSIGVSYANVLTLIEKSAACSDSATQTVVN
ncbi:RxLR-like protein [Plasmopara halstedii]|uniref:RxLR-like protein n=1 Tax=Plasmopara halstedii TaxID=4781 RepID=A0A0P1ATF3_PLAHL|nr:RxLR-like protein [Plasmopara halstedii]CEG44190.1 RxLR-like protein [Plasmopara halstedii]|eukprot:XP_024580559.1 RxLR-like protein [Plasmopara halstedii]